MNTNQPNNIKEQKGEFWSKPGAAEVYESGVSSDSGFIKIKNLVERTWVLQHAKGEILDAGTGTGRFAIPLAKVPGNFVVALDYSHEMIDLNRKLAVAQGVVDIEYFQGDIEHLPFDANRFDSVVSITVVRHFPQWQAILKEYIRVLKPGGKLIFEMCSGDHIQAANKFVARFGTKYSKDGFLSYEAEVPYEEIHQWLEAQGIEVVARHTYDFFNSNCFLKLVTINSLGYRIVLKLIKTFLLLPGLPRFWAWLELNVFRGLSTVWSYNYMIVGKKL